MKHILLDDTLPVKQTRPVLPDGSLDHASEIRLELMRQSWREAEREEDEEAKARLEADYSALHESCRWQEDWLIIEERVFLGAKSLLQGFGVAGMAITRPVYDQHLRMHPEVWKHALQTQGADWGRAVYRCRTCEGWSLAKPGCSACHDAGEVPATATGDYPSFSFTPTYQR